MTTRISFNYKKATVFAAFALITLAAALRHELWFDEAQAWCIVRDNDLAGIIEQLRYEGHPALWYLILLPFARLGCPCGVLPVISWTFSTAAAWLVIFKAPFGNIMKAAVVLSGGFLFYNSVISRPYCLIQLLLCVIAIVYPERRKCPVLFGVLVALLANTHVIMCGLIGFFGICMIIDLFGSWKDNPAKQNVGNIMGLVIAGAGVIVLVLPLIGSIGLNNMVSKPSELSAVSFLKLWLLPSDMLDCAIASKFELPAVSLVSSIIEVVMLAFFILLRYNRKCLIGALSFSTFYMVVNGLIWRNNTNRACIFLFVLVFFYWVSLGEDGRKIVHDTEKIQSKIAIRALKIDENGKKFCGVLLGVMLFCTTPVAAYTLAADIVGDFSPSARAAAYIRENFSEDTVLVCYGFFPPQVSAYLPEYTCYSFASGRYISYHPHYDEIEKDDYTFPHFEKACEVRLAEQGNFLFLAHDYIPFDVNYRYIGIAAYN